MTLKVYEDKEGCGAIYRQPDEWGDHLEFESVVKSLEKYRVGYMCFNVDWLDKEHYEWFCSVIGRQYQESVETAYELGKQHVRDEIKSALGIK